MRKTKYHIKKKIMPLLLAVAMAGTATPIYVAHPAIVKAAVSNAFGTNKISLSAGSYTVPVSLKKADDVEWEHCDIASQNGGAHNYSTADHNNL